MSNVKISALPTGTVANTDLLPVVKSGVTTGVTFGHTHLQTDITGLNPTVKHLYQTSTTVGNTADTNEDTLHTFTVPGGTLATDGDYLVLTSLVKNANNADSKQTRVRFGATIIGDSTGLVGANNNWWVVRAIIIRTSATAQKAIVWVSNVANEAAWNTAAGGNVNVTTPAETLANDIVLKVTGSTSAGVANDVTAQITTIDLVHAA